jgi:hypothetical protein
MTGAQRGAERATVAEVQILCEDAAPVASDRRHDGLVGRGWQERLIDPYDVVPERAEESDRVLLFQFRVLADDVGSGVAVGLIGWGVAAVDLRSHRPSCPCGADGTRITVIGSRELREGGCLRSRRALGPKGGSDACRIADRKARMATSR